MGLGLSDSAIHAVSGAAGGIAAMTVTYPLVSLSTRAQVASKHDQKTSMLAAAMNVIKNEGAGALYEGLDSSLLGIALTNGIYYLFFEESRALVLKYRHKSKATLSTLESIAVSAFAGAATAIISNPVWVINTRQTVRSTVSNSAPVATGKSAQEKKLGVWATLLHILRTEGVSSLFQGLGPALILVSNPVLQFTLFEQLKNLILKRRALRLTKGQASMPPLSDLDFFLLGAISKLFATSVTYPYLTVKARMQAGNAQGRSYTSTFDGLSKILSAEGIAGLYPGVLPKLSQSVATAAILFVCKERIYKATVKALQTVAEVA